MYPLVGFDGASLAMYPVVGFDGASLAMYPVRGGPPLSGAQSLYPFGVKESPNGTSLAMHHSVAFAFQAKGYVSKERLFLSDATSEALARRLPKICGGICLSVSL